MFTVTATPETLHVRQGIGTWLQVKELGNSGETGWNSASYLLPDAAATKETAAKKK